MLIFENNTRRWHTETGLFAKRLTLTGQTFRRVKRFVINISKSASELDCPQMLLRRLAKVPADKGEVLRPRGFRPLGEQSPCKKQQSVPRLNPTRSFPHLLDLLPQLVLRDATIAV